MSQVNSKNRGQKLAYLLSLFLVATPQLGYTQTSDTHAHENHQHQSGLKTYACPMHPEETSHEPGSRCPKCNMFLVEQEAQAKPISEQAVKTYACPMHPEETSHKAGSRCPKCNMFLVEQETQADPINEEAAKTYACPMHPEETSHEPGSRCPKCNMFLVAEEEEESPSTKSQAEMDHSQHDPLSQVKPAPLTGEPSIKYVCPMHAHIVSDVPGTCPICGMNLEKVEVGGNQQQIEIEVSGGMQQALALKVAKAEKDTLWKFVQTVGQIGYDESEINHIHARVNGWIEKLAINAVGDKITKGQLLYEIYSPDLINAQDDYLLALSSLNSSRDSGNYQDLVRKAGLRLELLGMNKAQIKRLAKTKQTQYRVPFYAKADGIVKELSVRDGMYIQPATEVISVVDLSKVWVIADVFENEQSWLAIGQQTEVSVPAMGLKGIEGVIDYIYPELDPVTRSLRVRIVVQNPDVVLRPNTLAKIDIFGGPNKDVLVIPQEALIQTGKDNRVIVKQSDSSFVARQVTVGMMSQGKAEILNGISEGEQVVISGQFLLDSEASLKGSLMRLSSDHQH
ncbi:efflux RND transporter periplasmic adaptor subunit [Shewanella psychrotolerans]|uniref:efflux RND transporter periplasmic adaptor subunit n=1 Tax=Shewanella psychrotolerans TaxID=2864206 RepID=UPI001C656009|nr:efflux RND transporter periplasmic adaptor subunit [Shewanella psychrotolerans]QYK01689.1 efflux RND transporter periplasmic adaptor subunit [Shewanella psychrotolerans]